MDAYNFVIWISLFNVDLYLVIMLSVFAVINNVVVTVVVYS